MTKTFIAANIYKTRITIAENIGQNFAACPYGKNFMLYHVPSGRTAQEYVKPFNTLKDCAAFGRALIERFPFLDAIDPPCDDRLNRESYAQFIKPWRA